MRPDLEESADESVPTYVCENCGKNEFYVEHSYTRPVELTHYVECSGESPSVDRAASRTILRTYSCTRRGTLGDDHRV